MRLIFIFLVLFSKYGLTQINQIKSIKKFSYSDGLSTFNIRKVAQDKYGFIWVATQDGLYRFDGSEFMSYSKNGLLGRNLLGVDIRDIIIDTPRDLIWVLSGEGGINSIHLKTMQVVNSIPIRSFDDEDWSICMAKSGDRIWVGRFSGIAIYNIKMKVVEYDTGFIKQLGSTKADIRNIFVDKLNNAWIAVSGYGLVIINHESGKIIEKIPLFNSKPSNNQEAKILSSVSLPNGTVIFGTSEGLIRIKFDLNYNFQIDAIKTERKSVLNNTGITSLSMSGKNKVLISTSRSFVVSDTSFTKITVYSEPKGESQDDWFSSVTFAYADINGNIWLGCKNGLAFCNQSVSPFLRLNDNYRNRIGHVYSIYPVSEAEILIGIENGLLTYNLYKQNLRKIADKSMCYYIYEDPFKYLTVSTKNGMFFYKKKSLIPIKYLHKEFTNFSKTYINSCVKMNDSIIIYGTENFKGILAWNFLSKKVVEINTESRPLSLAANVVNIVYKDKHGNVWVLADKAITILNPDLKSSKFLFLKDSIANKPLNIFFDIAEGADCYWIACYGVGVIQLDKTYKIVKIYSTKEGLCNNGVYKIFNVGDSSLIITTNNGLSVFNITNNLFKNYYREDGLHSNAFEEACGIQKDGKIYAGGVSGFTIISPSKFTINSTPPTFYFTNVKTEATEGRYDTINLELKELKISNTWLQTTVSFVGLNYPNPERVSYEYRIIERDTGWIRNNTTNFISLAGQSPGSYILEVKAANEDGYWCKPKQLILIFEPKWYQTLLFKIVVALAVGGLFYAFYLYRIRQIKAQHLIRKNIASDLHDDIGSTLNTVKVFTHLAKRDVHREEYLNQIEESLTEASIGLRDMIWVLDDSKDTVDELTERIKKFAHPITNANNIHFEIKQDVEGKNQSLSKTEKRNLLLMVKEIINNSIKYAECRKIKVVFKVNHDKKLVEISDDGKGFNTNESSEGNGLKNLYHRAAQIKYNVEIISSPGNGTTIKLEKE